MLDDVMVRANTKVDKDNTNLKYYVGGEHFSSGDVLVRRRGLIEGSTIGPMFYYGFKAGDFLLVSRNPHLKKAGIVDFDGICSEKTFVLETKNAEILLPEFLPFVLQNDRFWDYAFQNRHGSTNTFINWSTLAEYEFELPPVGMQRKLVKLLWSIVETREAYTELIRETNELVKSQFIEMMNSSTANAEKVDLGEVSEMVTVGIANSATQAYAESGVPMLRNLNIQENELDDKDLVFITKEFAERYKSKALRANDILIARTGYPGRACLVPPKYEGCQTFTTLIVRLKKANEIKPEFICHYINSPYGKNFVDSMKAGSSQQNFGATALAKMPVLLPPATLQERFINIWNQSDKSKFASQCTGKNTKEMMICLQKKILLNR